MADDPVGQEEYIQKVLRGLPPDTGNHGDDPSSRPSAGRPTLSRGVPLTPWKTPWCSPPLAASSAPPRLCPSARFAPWLTFSPSSTRCSNSPSAPITSTISAAKSRAFMQTPPTHRPTADSAASVAGVPRLRRGMITSLPPLQTSQRTPSAWMMMMFSLSLQILFQMLVPPVGHFN